MYRKNVAGQFVGFQLVKASDGSGLTGATVSVRRCIDGTFAAATGTVTEDTGGGSSPGAYKFALSQADTNGNDISLWFTASLAIPCMVNFLTTAADPSDAVRFGLTALPNAAAEASGGLPTLSAAQASNGTIQANVHRWLTGTPNALQSGRVDAYVGAMANAVITAATFAANALDAVWSTATRTLTSGANIVLAKGTGVTGFNDITAADVWNRLTSALTTVGSIGKLLVDNIDATISSRLASASYTAPPTAAANADAVWDEALSGHLSSGSTGEALSNASAAGDPWSVPLPGAYLAGEAGYIVGNNLDAPVSGVPDSILDASNTVETGLSIRGALRLALAALAGKLSGAAGTTVTIRNAVADSKNRIVATVDANGNRTAVTTDVS